MIQTLILDVEHAVSIGTPDQRAAMLRRITALFLDHAVRLGETEVEPFDAILLHLAQNVEVAARAVLAEEISEIANAPRRVVRDLAFDPAIAVAGPVLTRSERLAEDDLVRIAGEAGPLHLDAVARRRTLSQRITEILVTRATAAALRRIAGNESAHLSETGFAAMLAIARKDAVLRAILDLRRAVPESHWVGNATAKPGATVDVDLDEKAVVAFIAQGRVDDALLVIARIAQVPPAVVLQAYRRSDTDPLLFLVRSVDFGWGTLKHLIQSRPGRRLPPEEMRGAFEAFQALSVATARRSVRFNAAQGDTRVA
jgi:hypothetical protein